MAVQTNSEIVEVCLFYNKPALLDHFEVEKHEDLPTDLYYYAIDTNDKGGKAYFAVDSPELFAQYLVRERDEGRNPNAYEVIPGNFAQKLKFDIDADGTNMIYGERLKQALINSFNIVLPRYGINDAPKYLILDACAPNKVSYHFILGYTVGNNLQAKAFYNECLKEFPEELRSLPNLKNLVDQSPYSSFQCFRTVFSTKFEGERVLMYNEESTWKFDVVNNYYGFIAATLVTDIENTTRINVNVPEPLSKPIKDTTRITKPVVNNILASRSFESSALMEQFKQHEPVNGIIRLERICAGRCPICHNDDDLEAMHDKENGWITIDRFGRIKYHCFRAPGSSCVIGHIPIEFFSASQTTPSTPSVPNPPKFLQLVVMKEAGTGPLLHLTLNDSKTRALEELGKTYNETNAYNYFNQFLQEEKTNFIINYDMIYKWDNITKLWLEGTFEDIRSYLAFSIAGGPMKRHIFSVESELYAIKTEIEIIITNLPRNTTPGPDLVQRLENINTTIKWFNSNIKAKVLRKIGSFSLLKQMTEEFILRRNTKIRDLMDSDLHSLPCPPFHLIDLKTGLVRERTTADFWTKQIDANYDPNIQSNIFDNFIAAITNNDDSLALALQYNLGTCLSGYKKKLRKAIMMYGPDAKNGKSTLLDFIVKILGPGFCASLSRKHFIKMAETLADADAPKPFLYNCIGKRLVTISELGPKDKISRESLTTLVGTDTLSARNLYKTPVPFCPQFTLLLDINWLPTFDAENAVKDRLDFLFFPVRFVSNPSAPNEKPIDPDIGLSLALEEVKSACLNWLITGCKRYYNETYNRPESITNLMQEYFEENSPDDIFFSSMVHKPEAEIWAQNVQVHNFYKQWIGIHYSSHSRLTPQKFCAAMKKHGFEWKIGAGKTTHFRVYFDPSLLPSF